MREQQNRYIKELTPVGDLAMVARIFKSVKRLYLFFYFPTLSGDSGAVLTLSALPVMHHAQRQSQWQCKTITKGKITPKPHTGSQRSRCKQNTRYCINKQPCNCQAYAPSHTGNPPVPPCLLHLYSHLSASGCNLTHLYVPY